MTYTFRARAHSSPSDYLWRRRSREKDPSHRGSMAAAARLALALLLAALAVVVTPAAGAAAVTARCDPAGLARLQGSLNLIEGPSSGEAPNSNLYLHLDVANDDGSGGWRRGRSIASPALSLTSLSSLPPPLPPPPLSS